MHVSQRYTHTLGSVRVHVVYTRTNVELAHELAEIKHQPSVMQPLMRALSRRHSKVWSLPLAFLHINDMLLLTVSDLGRKSTWRKWRNDTRSV